MESSNHQLPESRETRRQGRQPVDIHRTYVDFNINFSGTSFEFLVAIRFNRLPLVQKPLLDSDWLLGWLIACKLPGTSDDPW